MKKGFLHHFFIIGSGTAINMLIGFFTTPVITRMVDPLYYGQLSIFTLYSGIGVMVLCCGLDQAFVRYYYQDTSECYKKNLLNKCFLPPALLTLVISIAFICLSIMKVLPIKFSPVVSLLLALNILFELVYRFCLLLARLEFNSKLFASLSIIYKIVYLVVAFSLIYAIRDYYYEVLAVATVSAAFVCMVIGVYSQREIWFIKTVCNPNREMRITSLLKYSLPLMLAMGVTQLFNAIDKLSLQYYCSYSDVGVYTSALTITSVFAIVQSTVNSLWGPATIEHYSKCPEDKQFYIKGNQMITVLMFFLGLNLIMFKDIIVFLIGEKYREAAQIIPLLVFNPIMYTISETTQIGISFKKKSGYQLVVIICACIVNIIGNTLLVPIIGQRGAAISTGLSYIVLFTMKTVLSNRLYYLDFKLLKFYIYTGFLCAYAIYSSFHQMDPITAIGYLIGIGFLIILYKRTIIEGINYIVSFLRCQFLQKGE